MQKKLSKVHFVVGVPEQVMARELKKEFDALAKIESLKSRLVSLDRFFEQRFV